MNIRQISTASLRFRKKRMQMFSSLVAADDDILDMGGMARSWIDTKFKKVILLNLDGPRDGTMGLPFVLADAKCPPFGDKAFKVVHSNSLIEHVGSWDDQSRLALEIRRLAPYYFVQTPNHWFPIEPHCLAPFIQFVPRRIRSWVAAWFSPSGWLASSHAEFAKMMDSVRLLTESEMRELFPEATIVPEKVFGLTKSFIAVHLPGLTKM